MNDKDLQRAKPDYAQNEIQSQGVITPEQRKIGQYRREQVTRRIVDIMQHSPKHMSPSDQVYALTTAICTFINQECQAAVKTYVWEQDKKEQEIADAAALRDKSIGTIRGEEPKSRAAADTDPATRYAAYANVLQANGVTNLSPELFRSIDAIVSLTSHWSK